MMGQKITDGIAMAREGFNDLAVQIKLMAKHNCKMAEAIAFALVGLTDNEGKPWHKDHVMIIEKLTHAKDLYDNRKQGDDSAH